MAYLNPFSGLPQIGVTESSHAAGGREGLLQGTFARGLQLVATLRPTAPRCSRLREPRRHEALLLQPIQRYVNSAQGDSLG